MKLKFCVKKVSGKCFTIYVSVYNTHPPFRAQMGGKKSVDYTCWTYSVQDDKVFVWYMY